MRPTRGVALLLTLAALVVVTTATVTLVRILLLEKTRARLELDSELAGDLLSAAEAPIQYWLEARSEEVVLPHTATEPRACVLDDAWVIEGRRYEIRIEAFDQAGMVSLRSARDGSPLRRFLPAEVREEIDAVKEPADSLWGLDLFPGFSFPAGESASAEDAADAEEADPALGALVATHGEAPESLNVHTAPLPLVQAVYRLSGLGGFEQVAEARAKGRLVAAVPPRSDRLAADKLPCLATRSRAWGFRVDARVGAAQCSIWAVYGPGEDEAWTCRQRLWIHD
ncbi:MAG: hypothetical protein HY812_19300 [Planctomycetes bacterium]|nr:hypothetical protein [Planctomycetota bacterium]